MPTDSAKSNTSIGSDHTNRLHTFEQSEVLRPCFRVERRPPPSIHSSAGQGHMNQYALSGEKPFRIRAEFLIDAWASPSLQKFGRPSLQIVMFHGWRKQYAGSRCSTASGQQYAMDRPFDKASRN